MPLAAAAVDTLASEFRSRIGADKVFADEGTRREYFEDITECPGHMPDLVVRPRETADVDHAYAAIDPHRIMNPGRWPLTE